jgi:spore coat protein U-like protein
MFKLQYTIISMIANILIFAPNVFAANTQGTINVTTNASSLCYLSTNSANIALTSYTMTSTAVKTASGGLIIYCTPGNIVTVSFGAGSSGNINNRTLISGSNTVNYNIYSDSTYTNILGDGTTGNTNVISFPSGGGVATNFYIKVPINQRSASGNYSDTVPITINY